MIFVESTSCLLVQLTEYVFKILHYVWTTIFLKGVQSLAIISEMSGQDLTLSSVV